MNEAEDRVSPVALPSTSRVSRFYASTDLADAYAIRLPPRRSHQRQPRRLLWLHLRWSRRCPSSLSRRQRRAHRPRQNCLRPSTPPKRSAWPTKRLHTSSKRATNSLATQPPANPRPRLSVNNGKRRRRPSAPRRPAHALHRRLPRCPRHAPPHLLRSRSRRLRPQPRRARHAISAPVATRSRARSASHANAAGPNMPKSRRANKSMQRRNGAANRRTEPPTNEARHQDLARSHL